MGINWTAVAALGQVGTLVAIPVSVLLYSASRKREEQSRLDSWEQFYAILDQQYFELLKILVQFPHLKHPSNFKTQVERDQYEPFAFAMWNFIESIFDYCERDPSLRESWHHILVLESKRHAHWFAQPANRRGFKLRFCQYIDETSGGTDLLHSALEDHDPAARAMPGIEQP